ncbi:globin-like protein, partial [Suhomyces tanzawaensis NRRL Y-17324]
TPTLHSNLSSSSINSGENNYQLVRMDTNTSITSDFSIQSQFKVSLKMSKKEIELIRYTWNKMLLDEPIEQKQNPFGMPGGFSTNITNSTAGSKEKTMNYINRTSASTVASSLFCRQFYSNLLSMDSNLEKLFPSIKHQAVSFAGVMSFAISQLENLSVLDDYLINLGKRHSRILGIEPANFELMGEALIQTFLERFGTRFTQELEVLWIKLYMYLANSLLQFGIDPIIKLNED